MGLLESGDRRCVLGADQLIGREPGAALRIDHDSVSWRHASLRWTGQAWELQDLGSLNGTFVNGQRMAAGARTLLRFNAELRFGDAEETWHLVNVDAPGTSVVELATGERIAAVDDLIALPAQDEPVLFISRQASGAWLTECGERVWEPKELEVLTVGTRQYRFEPGVPVYATTAGLKTQPSPATITLEFLVSSDEEHVEITIVHGERRIPLRPRAHSYLLLTLARVRAKDQSQSSLTPASEGWIYQDELLKMLATSPEQLAVDIYRARRQFSEAGVVDGAQVIERRATTHELRIGVRKLAIGLA